MKTMILAVTVLAVSATISGASGDQSDQSNRSGTRTFDQTVSLSPTGSLTLETHNGTIDVGTWDRPQVQIHARIEQGGILPGDYSRFEQTSVEVVSSADSVRITSKYPLYTWFWWSGNNPTIHYSVTAPRTAQWTIRDHNATTDIRDLHAPLSYNTHNGSLTLTRFDGQLDVTAHNGSVTADFLTFRGATISTHNGSAELTLPSSAAFNLRADSRWASIQSDFPASTRVWGRQQRLDATVKGGGPSLEFSSHRGRLRLRSKT